MVIELKAMNTGLIFGLWFQAQFHSICATLSNSMQYFYSGLADTTLGNIYIYEWPWVVFFLSLIPNPKQQK